MANFRFPENYTLEEVRRAIVSANIVHRGNGTSVIWARSSFQVRLDDVEHTVPAEEMARAMSVLRIKLEDAVGIFTQHGFGPLRTVLHGRRQLFEPPRTPPEEGAETPARPGPDLLEPLSEDERALHQNEMASIMIKLRLKHKHKLTDTEFQLLPSFNMLSQVVQAIAFSFSADVANWSIQEMERQNRGTVEIAGPILEKHGIANDAQRWLLLFSGIKPDGSKTSGVELAVAYEELLNDLIKCRHGRKVSDTFLRELDKRLKAPAEATRATEINWPPHWISNPKPQP